jgi:hypothetical protein
VADERDSTVEEFFDPSFLAELEGLAGEGKGLPAPIALTSGEGEKLARFLAPAGAAQPLDEEAFVALPTGALLERGNALIDLARSGSAGRDALQAVENFIVFFQTLVPTLSEEAASDIKRFFFRLVPTLIHISYNDFSLDKEKRIEGVAALRNLETILIEISNVRLAPSEKELVFRNIDQMAAFIAVGEYTMANEAISSQLLGIIRGNKLTRALFRLMEVEVTVQVYLKERFGYLTPQIRIPEDLEALGEYGPLRVLDEESAFGDRKRFIQVHIPEIQILRDIVMRLVRADGSETYDLRLDALGSAELTIPPGAYSLGLVYQPE